MRRVLIAAVATVALLSSVPAAHGGTFDVFSCKGPGGEALGHDGWNTAFVQTGFSDDTCVTTGQPGRWRVYDQPNGGRWPVSANYGLRFIPPESLKIAAYDLAYGARPSTDGSYAWNFTIFENEPNFARAELLKRACWANQGCVGGDDTIQGAPGAATQLIMIMDCSGGSGAYTQGCPGGTSELALRGAKITLDDTADPAFTGAPSGPLVSGQTVSGTVAASFTAADTGGGIARVVAEVDGRELGALDDANDGACVLPYSRPQPCRSSVSGSVGVDTTRLTDGAHTVRLLAYDATRTNVAAFGPVALKVSNGPRACAAGATTRVRARLFGGRTRRTVPFGSGSTVTGTVKDAAGAPVPGAVVALSAGRTRFATAGTATTGPDGRWRAKVGPGTSRRVFASVRAGDAPPACSGVLRLDTRAGVTIKATRRSVGGGGTARFTGRVRGERAGRANVLLQGYEPSQRRWRTVATARVRKNGRFSARYSFKGGGGSTFSFRAAVKPSRGYPYAAGVSKRTRVRAG